jgi:hypothetical protein
MSAPGRAASCRSCSQWGQLFFTGLSQVVLTGGVEWAVRDVPPELRAG